MTPSGRGAPGLRVNEIFFSIQGEGSRAGMPCVFVRLTGCPLRCSWCDTEYAFHDGRPWRQDEIVEEIQKYPCRMVCITGGEPLAQPPAFDLIHRLAMDEWLVLVETSGHVPVGRLHGRAVVIMDIKCPGSGQAQLVDWDNLKALHRSDELKFVVLHRADYEWARGIVRDRGLADRFSNILFSPVHGVLDPAELARWIVEDGLAVRLQIQLHKYLWPAVTRGV